MCAISGGAEVLRVADGADAGRTSAGPLKEAVAPCVGA